MLSEKGRVLVRVGQKVGANDVIAEAPSRSEHILLDIRRSLGLGRNKFSRNLIGRKVGESLQEGDLIAEAGGIFKRIVRAPSDCEVIAISGSKVLLEVAHTPVKLLAGISGEVVEVIPDRGAILDANGALLQGVWGNQQINMGILFVKAERPDDEFTKDDLDVSMRGAIVFGGHCSQVDALLKAAELPLRGLILGSMTSDLVPVASQLDFPLILLEGFGRLPVNNAAYKILTTNSKREISLNAASWNRHTGERPEALISLPAQGGSSPETGEFQPGQLVRIHSEPYASLVGKLDEVLSEYVVLPNNLRT
ncbi:MAG: hypothetical protein MUO76_08820, partial [Anaerolineaceae bacterium]|nr:hypothetical protein [Anaerolineaceae bacterium]